MATFTNQATLSYNGVATNSNVVVGEILEVLTVTKNALVDSYAANGDVTYVISIVNSGAAAFSNLTVTDDLGAYADGNLTQVPLTYIDGSLKYYVNGVLQAAPAVTAGPPLTVGGISVPAGGNAVIIYEAQVNGFAPLAAGSSIVNEAAVSGAGITQVSAEETVTVREGAELSVLKALSPLSVPENGQVTYTFTITNNGNTAVEAGSDIVLSDVFDPPITITSVTFDGTPWTSPANYTYDQQTGEFATVAGQITVPAATYTQNSAGEWVAEPGVSTLVIVGNV
ncbi:MAG: hypothetical protein IJC94_00570 [Oscillospiraceae bacterium]|nr:hypothetical protein [Oscillospiraceae bacterium]